MKIMARTTQVTVEATAAMAKRDNTLRVRGKEQRRQRKVATRPPRIRAEMPTDFPFNTTF
jgi:hypothetical protein